MFKNKAEEFIASAMISCLILAGSVLAEENELIRTAWFGGPVYDGKPDLKIAAALVKAGGGAGHFSFKQALVSMLGEKIAKAELAKLTKQYGAEQINEWINGMDFTVADSLKRAADADIKLPTAPADLKGEKLARALISAGTAPKGMYWAGWMFDHILSHDIHNQVMIDIDSKYDHAFNKRIHGILNQAMYDIAHTLGEKHIKLSPLTD
jgi:hypothetical protein